MKQVNKSLHLVPQPETTSAFLISAGIRRPAFTLHHYYETRPTRTRNGERVWEHMFKCIRTGMVRRWGIVDRDGSFQDDVDDLMAHEGN